jgi:hypothetical protein
MAGDWIKMRVDLAEDPAVIAMADDLDIDEYAVVGRLHRLWSWVSAHSADGKAHVSAARVDKIAQCDGFAAALESVGWLQIGAENGSPVITIPKFDLHNSKSAKRRASEADRKWRVRNASAERPQSVRTEAPKRREEKRREYKEPVSGFRKVHWWKGLSEPDLADDSKIDVLFGAVVAAGYANDTPEDRQRFAALVFSIRRAKAKKPFGLMTSVLEGKVKNDYAPEGPGQTDWRNRAKESDHDSARRALKQLDGIGSAQTAAAPDTQAEARNQAARLAEFQAKRSKNGKAAS